MAILTILQYPDSKLRIVAKPVTVFDANLARLADDMLETMYDAHGIGLAATQVNVHKRVVVMDISENRDEPKILINPEVEVLGKDTTPFVEGCLSVPSLQSEISRPTHIRLKWQDVSGEWHEKIPDGLEAICVQHELDHLIGKVFVDYLTPAQIRKYRRAIDKGNLDDYSSEATEQVSTADRIRKYHQQLEDA